MDGVTLFYQLLYGNEWLYANYIFLSALIYYIIYKKYVNDIFDPLFLIIVGQSFILADLFLMYFNGRVSDFNFYAYIVTQISFVFGFYGASLKIKKEARLVKKINPIYSRSEVSYYYYSVSAMYIITQAISFVYVGIPLLAEYRLSTYAEGGGIGILGRVSQSWGALAIYFFFMSFKYDENIRNSVFKYILFFIISILFVAQGAKSALLPVLYILFIVNKRASLEGDFNLLKSKFNGMKKKLFILSISAAILVISVENMLVDDSSSVLYKLYLRFIQYGDILMMAYQNNTLENVTWSNPLLAIFGDVLGMFRLISWSDVPKELGNSIFEYNYDIQAPKGPNPIHNVFGVFYFGFFGGIIYSFAVGYILGVVRKICYSKSTLTMIGGSFYSITFTYIHALPIDVKYSIQLLTGLVFFGLPLIFIMKTLRKLFFIIRHENSFQPAKL